MLLTVVTKFLGFGREIALSSSFGTSALSDAYILSIAIPGFFFTIISSAINSTFIPTIVILKSEDKQNSLTSSVINFFLIIITCVILVIFFVPTFFVDIYASNLPDEVRSIAVSMLKVTCFSLLFRVLVAILNSYLQFKGLYVLNTLLGLPLNIIIIFSIFYSTEETYEFLAIGFLIAMISQLLFILPFVLNSGFRYSLAAKVNELDIKKYSSLLLFVVAGVAMNEINMLIDINIASGLGVGYVSSINYALKLNIFIQAVFVSSLVLVFFPNLSKLAQDEDREQSNTFFNDGLEIIFFLLFPISSFTLFFSESVVDLIYFNGNFDEFSLANTSQALLFYSIGFVFFGLREFLIKSYYAVNDMKTPMWNTLLGVMLNVYLTITLSKFMGIGGIALATSLSSMLLCSLLIFNIIRKKIFVVEVSKLTSQIFSIALASVASLGGILILNNYFNTHLLMAMFFYLVLYLLLSSMLRVDMANTLIVGIKNKIWK